MKVFVRRRVYVNLIIAAIVSLLLTFPMILELMGFDPFSFNHDSFTPDMTTRNVVTVIVSYVFYMTMIFTLLSVFTYQSGLLSYPAKITIALVVTSCFFAISPLVLHRPMNRMEPPVVFDKPFPEVPEGSPHDPGKMDIPRPKGWLEIRRIIEFSFILATTGLIGKVFELVGQREEIRVENEKLRADNLQSQYNLLVNQVNPHFFFNSMNSLSSLVREDRKENALRYIAELSDTYRYVLQNSGTELVTLEEEMKSLSAYCYLLQIRYEGKIFFKTEVDEKLMKMLLPVFSLQPLVENVVKHNTITEKQPMTVVIRGNAEGYLTITNLIKPRLESEEHTGIGLQNLMRRYRLLTGKDIIIEDDAKEFSVILPLKTDDRYEDTNS